MNVILPYKIIDKAKLQTKDMLKPRYCEGGLVSQTPILYIATTPHVEITLTRVVVKHYPSALFKCITLPEIIKAVPLYAM